MKISNIEEASNNLTSCIGKYIVIYHKYKCSKFDASFTQDMCVAKVVSVTKPSFMNLPIVKIQFHNGKTAEFVYESQYKGHLRLHWDYKYVGCRFNDMFIAWTNNGWNYTYPDPKNRTAAPDYFLTTGDLSVRFFESDEESLDTIIFYGNALKEAEARREILRNNGTTTTPIKSAETIPTVELDKVFFAGA